MAINDSQKSVITWAIIIGVSGYGLYKLAGKFGLLPAPDAPLIDNNKPTAKDYTHTPNFNSGLIAKKIFDLFKWFGTDPFSDVMAILKEQVLTQGDWLSLNQSFNQLYGEDLYKYFQDLGGGLAPVPFWDEFSQSELQQVTTYINSLPL